MYDAVLRRVDQAILDLERLEAECGGGRGAKAQDDARRRPRPPPKPAPAAPSRPVKTRAAVAAALSPSSTAARVPQEAPAEWKGGAAFVLKRASKVHPLGAEAGRAEEQAK